MRWFGSAADPADTAAAAARQDAWKTALDTQSLPPFVQTRLAEAKSGARPWLAMLSPAELLAERRHGIRPLATVSGTCWYHFGYSWTNGHAEGWHLALDRLKREAVAAGANAVVDVTMRTSRLRVASSMDYTVVGTAVRIEGLPPSREPVIATVPALQFMALLSAGIVPTGIAIGACYHWLTGGLAPGSFGFGYRSCEVTQLTRFWEQIRREALADLSTDGRRLGTGVLAHTHFGQLLRIEGGENQPPRFLGRHIVIGTAVESRPGDPVTQPVGMLLDMRDERSPLAGGRAHGHTAYSETNDEDGAI